MMYAVQPADKLKLNIPVRSKMCQTIISKYFLKYAVLIKDFNGRQHFVCGIVLEKSALTKNVFLSEVYRTRARLK